MRRRSRRLTPHPAPSSDALGPVVAFGIFAAAACAAAADAEGAPPDRAPPDGARFFAAKVLPVLESRCFQCHGERRQRGELRLDSRESVLEGGERGPAIAPGDPDTSLLVRAIRHEDEDLQMPPRERLPEGEVAILVEWVKRGAPWPAPPGELAPRAAPAARDGFSAEDRAYWAFQPLAKPPVPDLGVDGPRHPVDAFIEARLAAEGVEPAPRAGRRTLIRRASFDLVGLPPTREDVQRFEEDASPAAWEKLVDRLLASPRYGERWGRHWLDLVRYSDSDGFRADDYRPLAWKYRDYVVRSFNEDTPYDRFVREQLAGDEIYPDDPDAITATGYLRLWPYEHNQRDVHRQWNDIIDDITSNTGEVFLGLSFGCARCHDHKFDPILQRDYYRLRAFFEAVMPYDDLVAAPRSRKAEYRAALGRWLEATAELRAAIEEIEAPVRNRLEMVAFEKFMPEYQDLLRRPFEGLSPAEKQIHHLASRQLIREARDFEKKIEGAEKTRWEELRAKLAEFDSLRPEPLPPVLAVVDVGEDAPPTRLPGSGDAAPIAPGFLTILGEEPEEVPPVPENPRTTGRRSALARWIASDENPLAARVLVNRLWQMHFGRGLVATPNDFGRQGAPPSHPELLDWLACELVERGWSVKAMHRLILTSAAYQRASVVAAGPPPASDRVVKVAYVPSRAVGVDPENQLLWRGAVRRMDAEALRDALLAVSGELDLRMGGPGAKDGAPRRLVYLKVMRNSPAEFAETFDGPDGFNSCARRSVTTTAPQALLLLNGGWVLGRAARLAEQIEAAGGDGDLRGLARRVFVRVLGREPERGELDAASAFLAEGETLAGLAHVLLNTNEFLYAD